jgi:hypothetical protein
MLVRGNAAQKTDCMSPLRDIPREGAAAPRIAASPNRLADEKPAQMPLRGSFFGGFQLAPSQKSSAAASSMRSRNHEAVRFKRRAIEKIVARLPLEVRSFRKKLAFTGRELVSLQMNVAKRRYAT